MGHGVGGLVDDFEGVFAFFLIGGGVKAVPGGKFDAGERGAELVGGVSGELFLSGEGAFKSGDHLIELGGEAGEFVVAGDGQALGEVGFVDLLGGGGDVFDGLKGAGSEEHPGGSGEDEGGGDQDEEESRLGLSDALERGEVGGELENGGVAVWAGGRHAEDAEAKAFNGDGGELVVSGQGESGGLVVPGGEDTGWVDDGSIGGDEAGASDFVELEGLGVEGVGVKFREARADAASGVVSSALSAEPSAFTALASAQSASGSGVGVFLDWDYPLAERSSIDAAGSARVGGWVLSSSLSGTTWPSGAALEYRVLSGRDEPLAAAQEFVVDGFGHPKAGDAEEQCGKEEEGNGEDADVPNR